MSGPAPWDAQETARSFGDVVRAVLRRKKFAEKGRYGRLVKVWNDLVGPGVAEHTRVKAFQDGRLVVDVGSPALLHELNGFLKDSLLAGMQSTDAGRDIARLEFRLGVVRCDGDEGR